MENWTTVCSTRDLTPNGGICAKVDDNQVAIFTASAATRFMGSLITTLSAKRM